MTTTETNHLHRAHRGAFDTGPDHDSSVVGDLSEQVRGAVQQLFEATVRRVEECTHPLLRGAVERARRCHVVDVEAIPLVGGDTARRRVRLGEETLLLEHGHFVTNGC